MLNGKLAVVTGGANGIGASTSRLLAGTGSFGLDVRSRIAAREQRRAVLRPSTSPAASSIDAGFAASGAPDILMVNAGIAEEEDFLDHAADRWDRTLAINLTGAFHTIQAASRLMKARRSGAIVHHGVHQFVRRRSAAGGL